jgi:hypothetical protein
VLVEQIPAGVQTRLRLKTTSFVSTLPRAWHGAHDLSAAFLTAIGHVINLVTRNEDAHFHEHAAGLERRQGFLAAPQASPQLLLPGHGNLPMNHRGTIISLYQRPPD